jgi:beta-galactosidase
MNSTFQIRYDAKGFYINNTPFLILSGEMHYQRIPHEYWRQRLQMARAMGLNTVAVYMFWNMHEPKPGEFYFSERNDVAQFVRLAQEVGLYVILRPGPYCCAEWDFGGFPPWLLAKADMRLRCMEPAYIEAITRYIKRWSQELVPLQSTKGGPILMVQVENEYGSYGRDKEYLRTIKTLLEQAGFEVPLFTCDGPGDDMLFGGTLPELLACVNFGPCVSPENQFKKLDEFRPGLPHICTEFYPGWFTHWGHKHMFRKNVAKRKLMYQNLEWFVNNNVSFSLYMVHGGTNWGFMAGANYFNQYKPDITSYDYDAPMDERGAPTQDFHWIRTLLEKHQFQKQALPPIPTLGKIIEIPPIEFKESVSIWNALGNGHREAQIKSMEIYGQNYGMIVYRTYVIPAYSNRKVKINELHDYGHIFLDGQRIATLYRGDKQFEFKLPKISKPKAQLDIIVESHGRVNYGAHILDRKGITEEVSIEDRIVFMDWEVFHLPCDENYLNSLNFGPLQANSPAFYRGTFNLTETGDTYLDTRLWKKGMVWINGHNLGRYWEVGPQFTLYVPAPWLKVGENEIIIFDMEGSQTSKLIQKLLKKEWNQVPISNQSIPPMRGIFKPIFR